MTLKSRYKNIGLLFIVVCMMITFVSFKMIEINGAIGASIISISIGVGLGFAFLVRSSMMCEHSTDCWSICDECRTERLNKK